MFNLELIDEVDTLRKGKTNRNAVRGLILNNHNELLLIKSDIGDYRIPGGQIDEEDGEVKTLKNKLLIETNLDSISIIKKLGRTIRIKNDKKDNNSIITMTNHYYLCRYNNEFHENISNQLEWVSLTEAYNNNLILYKKLGSSAEWLKNGFKIFDILESILPKYYFK